MSGIVGTWQLDGRPVTAETLQPAMAAIAQYGGDDRDIWISGPVGLGAHVLRLEPESAGERLPLTRGELTITADVRLDNRAELFAALGIPASERAGLPDSDLILRAYAQWGEACPEYLIGDYAFAIWDAREQRLFAARDHIGARPFYYYHAARTFAFATDIRGVLAFPGVPDEIDEAEIARYLLARSIGYHDNVHTFFKNLSKLPFGHRLVLDRAGLRVARHWHPENLLEIRLATLDDYTDRLYMLVEQAVADRLRTNARVGAHLSGGLDSSSVAVQAARLLKARGAPSPGMFSWSPPPDKDPEKTEHRRIEAICRQEGLTPIYTELTIEDERQLDDVDISLKPVANLGLEQVVQREAAARGIRLLLSGWGGDEGVSFNGRGLAAEYLVKRQWRDLAEYLQLATVRSPRRLLSIMRTFWRAGILPTLPDPLFDAFAYREAKQLIGKSCINPEFAGRIRRHLRPPAPSPREIPGTRATQLRLYHYGHLTARMESWAAFGADHGLTYAYPLTDRRVLEFAYAMPGKLHRQNGKSRYLYRQAMAGLFPPGVSWDSAKEDPALEQRARQQVKTYAGLAQDERLKNSHPWLDTNRFRRILLKTASGQSGGVIALRRALACLSIFTQHGR
ncbi:MAG TPA: asparagine synthase-related protein [Opitutaceae bacterium]|nr:asparagine synthase-related protein [Opitutaceae bacterium]